MFIYGVGGIIVPFIFIKLIDLIIVAIARLLMEAQLMLAHLRRSVMFALFCLRLRLRLRLGRHRGFPAVLQATRPTARSPPTGPPSSARTGPPPDARDIPTAAACSTAAPTTPAPTPRRLQLQRQELHAQRRRRQPPGANGVSGESGATNLGPRSTTLLQQHPAADRLLEGASASTTPPRTWSPPRAAATTPTSPRRTPWSRSPWCPRPPASPPPLSRP